MPEPVELKGRPAAPGIAAGPLFRLDAEIARRLPTGDAEARARGAERRGAALDRADRRPDERRREGRRRGILEFQAAMLSDDELIDPAFALIEAGDSAEAAWLAALAEQIAGYETADDDYFRARAADLDRPARPRAAQSLRRRSRGAAARRHPDRRRRDADALPGDRLVARRRRRAFRRQRHQPRRHARARARRADGGRPRRHRVRRPSRGDGRRRQRRAWC